MSSDDLDVLIVGAGPAGVGCGIVFQKLGFDGFALLERDRVGASFHRWPAETRLITPSFPTHSFGMPDLNAVAPRTSPGWNLRRDHPSGPEYGDYLQKLARYFELPVLEGVDVRAVQSLPAGGFSLDTSHGEMRSKFVIWATGEFQYPRRGGFAGADLCRHSSTVESWSKLDGDDFIIIGGAESGADAAIHLAAVGKRARVIDAHEIWDSWSSDPSVTLSPFTHERLTSALATERVALVRAKVRKVTHGDDGYWVHGWAGKKWWSPVAPILATGFEGGVSLVRDLFKLGERGEPLLTQHDESTHTPGLFLTGPKVQHGGVIFCFIYKFRQRFAVVVEEIAGRLGLDTTPLAEYRTANMYLDDLSCCLDECQC